MSYDGKLIVIPARDLEKMQDAVLLRVWLYCLHRMARRKTTETVRSGRGGTKDVTVQPGQFANQRGRASQDLGLPPSTTHQKIRRLESMGKVILGFPPDKQWTLVTVVNYDLYVPSKGARRTTKGSPMFEEFWALWPKHFRKASKAKCLAVWKRDALEKKADHVLAVLRRLKASENWKEKGGQYVPAPLVWLNKQRWDRSVEDIEDAATAGPKEMSVEKRMQVHRAWSELPEETRRKYEDVHGYGGDRPMWAWWREEGQSAG